MKKQKIAYLGNFSVPWCTEVHVAKTLEKLGHEVIRLQENTSTLGEVVLSANSSDLFLWTRTYGYASFDLWTMLEQITVPTVSFHLDYYFGISRQLAMKDDPFWQTGYVFQPDGDHMREFKDLGCNAYWLPPAVFEDGCSLVERPMVHDLVFVGSWQEYHGEWPWRRQLVQEMQRRYPRFETYPRPGEGAIREEPLNELYQSTKVVVGDSLNLPGNKTYTSDRIFETIGRGGFILYPDIEWLTSILPKEIFYQQGDIASVEEKVDFYLGDSKGREVLRRECYEIVKKDHTYTNRLRHLLEVVNG